MLLLQKQETIESSNLFNHLRQKCLHSLFLKTQPKLYPKKPQPIENVLKTMPIVLNKKLCSRYIPIQIQLFQSFDEQIFKMAHDHDLKILNDLNLQNGYPTTSFPYWRTQKILQIALNFPSQPFKFIDLLCVHLQIFFTSNKPFLTKIVPQDHLSLSWYVFLFICFF